MTVNATMFDLRLMPPTGMTIVRPPASLRPPESLSGDGAGVMFSVGRTMITYDAIRLWSKESHLAYNRLRFWAQGGVRAVHVPMITDYIAPTILEDGPLWTDAFFQDGWTFTDGGFFEEGAIIASVAEAADLNAGTLKIKITSGGELVGGEVFSLFSPVIGHHPYDIVQIDDVQAISGGKVYTCWISPGLFEPAEVGDEARFVYPLCTSIVQDGEKLPYEVNYRLLKDVRPTVKFIEKLGW